MMRPQTAYAAGKRRRLVVKAHVTDEVVAVGDRLVANVARKFRHTSVDVQVRLQLGKLGKRFAANAASAGPRVRRQRPTRTGALVLANVTPLLVLVG